MSRTNKNVVRTTFFHRNAVVKPYIQANMAGVYTVSPPTLFVSATDERLAFLLWPLLALLVLLALGQIAVEKAAGRPWKDSLMLLPPCAGMILGLHYDRVQLLGAFAAVAMAIGFVIVVRVVLTFGEEPDRFQTEE